MAGGDVTARRNRKEGDLKAKIEGIRETIRRLTEELEQALRENEEGKEECDSGGGEGPEGWPEDEREDSKD